MTPILDVKNLRKSFGNNEAVKGISFAIPAGCCFGLLGPNGAGKTTTIEMIEGITAPSGGNIFFKGQPKSKDFLLQSGIQFQSTALMDYLKTREVLALFAKFYPHSRPLDELIALCHLEDFLDTYATRLSGGQRQRLLLAVALINNPEVLFLDEPTTGLDPQSRRHFWSLIENIKAEGKTVLITTHYMEEAEVLCDHLAIMDKGELIIEGSPESLLNAEFDHSFVCINTEDFCQGTTGNTPNNDGGDKMALFEMAKQQFPQPMEYRNGYAAIVTTDIQQTLAALNERNISLRSLRVESPSLDDLFLKLTGHRLRE